MYVLIILAMLIFPIKSYAFEVKGIEIKPHAGIFETYDDNITFVDSDKEQDFITDLNLGFSAKYEKETTEAALTVNINEQLFAQHTKFDNTSEDMALDYKTELSKYDRFSLSESFEHAYEPKSFAETFGRTLGRFSYYVNKFAMEYARELSRQITAKVTYTNELDLFSREGISDSFLNKIGVEADYAASSQTTMQALYEISQREFNPGHNALENSLSCGIKHYLTRQVSVNGRTGIDFIESYTDKLYTKPLFYAAVTDEFDDKTSANLSVTKEYTTTPYMEDVFNSCEIALTLTRQLLKNFSCSLDSFYGKGKYVASNIRDELSGGKLGFVYNLRSNTKVTLSYTYENVNSTDETREFTRNTIGLGLNMEF